MFVAAESAWATALLPSSSSLSLVVVSFFIAQTGGIRRAEDVVRALVVFINVASRPVIGDSVETVVVHLVVEHEIARTKKKQAVPAVVVHLVVEHEIARIKGKQAVPAVVVEAVPDDPVLSEA